MSALNETSELWTFQMSKAEGAASESSGSIVPDCCFVICDICCWVVC